MKEKTDNGMLQRPRVRLEVRETVDTFRTREEADWPLPGTKYRELYLDGHNAALSTTPPLKAACVSYDAKAGASAYFDLRFTERSEIS
jgi:hypothetical protein